MQAIARANRVNEGKNNGLIVDYCGILKYLREALATFAGTTTTGPGGDVDPAKPKEELLEDLAESINFVRTYLDDKGSPLDDVIAKSGFGRNAAILACKEAANENDETRKRFEVMCREVFKKFKACLTISGVNAHRADRDAINIVYKSLQQDRDQADISHIIRELHKIVDEAIEVHRVAEGSSEPYDISRIDFERLKQEFERSPKKNTTVQDLRQAVETRLRKLLEQNPLPTDFQKHLRRNRRRIQPPKRTGSRSKKTFEALLKLVQELDQEDTRAVREGLDEESLAIFDLLKKESLSKKEVKRIKAVAVSLLQQLKTAIERVDHWRDKETTRDAVYKSIHDFLYSDETGLPVNAYTPEDVNSYTEDVFRHVYRAYPTVPSPYYPSEMQG